LGRKEIAMKLIVSVVITLALIFGFFSTFFAYSKKEIVNDLISIVIENVKKDGLNDIRVDDTKVVDLRIVKLGDGYYRAMADVRIYSEKWGEYYVAVYRNNDSHLLTSRYGYIGANYQYNLNVKNYEDTLKLYYELIKTGGITHELVIK
jgi:hypothetical protein